MQEANFRSSGEPKICDKVGNISLNGGKSVLEQLAELAGVQD